MVGGPGGADDCALLTCHFPLDVTGPRSPHLQRQKTLCVYVCVCVYVYVWMG